MANAFPKSKAQIDPKPSVVYLESRSNGCRTEPVAGDPPSPGHSSIDGPTEDDPTDSFECFLAHLAARHAAHSGHGFGSTVIDLQLARLARKARAEKALDHLILALCW